MVSLGPVLITTTCNNSCIVVAALLLTTEDTLSRPMPHVYKLDAESHQAIPIVVPEAVQRETDAAVGSGIGFMSDVNVKELRIIANQQVQLITQSACSTNSRITTSNRVCYVNCICLRMLDWPHYLQVLCRL